MSHEVIYAKYAPLPIGQLPRCMVRRCMAPYCGSDMTFFRIDCRSTVEPAARRTRRVSRYRLQVLQRLPDCKRQRGRVGVHPGGQVPGNMRTRWPQRFRPSPGTREGQAEERACPGAWPWRGRRACVDAAKIRCRRPAWSGRLRHRPIARLQGFRLGPGLGRWPGRVAG